MARPGVTYAEVAEAATQLLGQEKNPTIEQIRILLGSGSSTTIAKHLKKWKESQKSTSLLAAKENLPEELVTLLKGLWERVIDHSEMKLHTIETRFENTTAELQNELQKYKTNNQRWQNLFNQWQQEKENLSNEKISHEKTIDELQKNLLALQAKHDASYQQLEEKQVRVDELNRLLTQSQNNLEHYRESVREQRLVEQQQFLQQKQELQIEIKAAKEQIAAMQNKLIQWQQQHQLLQQSHSILEKNHAQVEKKLEELKKILAESEQEKNKYLEISKHWQHQYQELQQVLEKKTNQFINIQAENKTLIQQLEDAKQSIKDAFDQKKLISHEKWLMSQEKAQLEGQLKQLEAIMGT